MRKIKKLAIQMERDELLPGQTHVDRHDLFARVFVLKLKKINELNQQRTSFRNHIMLFVFN